MSFGSRCTERREALGLSVVALSRRTGLSRPSIYALESGRRMPNLKTAIRIAAELQISIDEMCADEVDEIKAGQISIDEMCADEVDEIKAGQISIDEILG